MDGNGRTFSRLTGQSERTVFGIQAFDSFRRIEQGGPGATRFNDFPAEACEPLRFNPASIIDDLQYQLIGGQPGRDADVSGLAGAERMLEGVFD